MQTELSSPVIYKLPIADQFIDLNALIGQQIKIKFTGQIFCIHCLKKTSKSFNQGYCYPCFTRLAQCDICIMKPETCHFDHGTCREPDWALEYCYQPHIVYLANSSGVKVGITRGTQIPTRWIDQGAIQALPIVKVASRHASGLVEVLLAKYVSDKTSWQRMLKNQAQAIDLIKHRDELLQQCNKELMTIEQRFGKNSLKYLHSADVVDIRYPVITYPEKVKSVNFDKQSEISGILQGIKGQYMIFDTGVINIRKFGGYEVSWEVLGKQQNSFSA